MPAGARPRRSSMSWEEAAGWSAITRSGIAWARTRVHPEPPMTRHFSRGTRAGPRSARGFSEAVESRSAGSADAPDGGVAAGRAACVMCTMRSSSPPSGRPGNQGVARFSRAQAARPFPPPVWAFVWRRECYDTQPQHALITGPENVFRALSRISRRRVEVRRPFFTRLRHLRATLDRYLEFCNDRRPNLGYRTRGQLPADLFWGAIGRSRHGEPAYA